MRNELSHLVVSSSKQVRLTSHHKPTEISQPNQFIHTFFDRTLFLKSAEHARSQTSPTQAGGIKTKKDKKIPAGYPAGEGGMVEEIYIHYYRHLIRLKSYTFLKKFFKKL
jgi:hypothetical protein